ncbi:MAG: hypothetical protein IJC34_04530 [Lentisphaeria bacterium]|nr:hypothetical protein [Lentisphaeria bacterium]MBQ7394583.1 hypothetical protein [Lentisphaeria bacterium]
MSRSLLFCSAVLMTALFLSGCNEYERRGLSPLPHNRPAAWESRPFGDAGFRN